MEVNIVGNGSFGKFLKQRCVMLGMTLNPDADTVILAVPFEAYEAVANAHAGKHLVNVCSVQEETNEICLKYSDRVTGLHPLFGVRTKANSEKRCALTLCTSKDSYEFVKAFEGLHEIITVGASEHDIYMAKTHAKVVEVSERILQIVEEAKGVPDEFLTPSFRKMKDLAEQLLDMPEGTKSSILANKYI